MIRAVSVISCVTFVAGALGGSAGAAIPKAESYSLAASVRCVKQAGGKVGAVRRTDRRRIAISDLAQHTSREIRFGRHSVLLAFTRGTAEAQLLHELLVVPRNPYVLRGRSNVVLMYRPAAVAAFRRVAGCLRVR
jgi:hypothetical protein